jgi:hypothetical protein
MPPVADLFAVRQHAEVALVPQRVADATSAIMALDEAHRARMEELIGATDAVAVLGKLPTPAQQRRIKELEADVARTAAERLRIADALLADLVAQRAKLDQ